VVTLYLQLQIQVQVLEQLELLAHQILLVKAEVVFVSSATQDHNLDLVDQL
jgi:hypothetical protein